MKLQDTQFTDDELALMRGDPMPDEAEASDEHSAAGTGEADDDATDPAAENDAPMSGEEAASDAASEADDAEPDSTPFRFDGKLPDDYADKKQALRAEKAQLRMQWSNGELSDDEFAASEAKWEDKYEALQAEYLTAQALATANAQIVAQENTKVLRGIANEAAKQGIDYGDATLAMVYDAKLTQVRGDKAFEGKSFAEQAAEAHARVAAMFGKATTPPTDTKADGAKPNKRSQIPPTLGNMPAAAAQNLNQDLGADDLDDDPDIAEARWAQMPTNKRQAVLRSTLPTRR